MTQENVSIFVAKPKDLMLGFAAIMDLAERRPEMLIDISEYIQDAIEQASKALYYANDMCRAVDSMCSKSGVASDYHGQWQEMMQIPGVDQESMGS